MSKLEELMNMFVDEDLTVESLSEGYTTLLMQMQVLKAEKWMLERQAEAFEKALNQLTAEKKELEEINRYSAGD